MNAQYKYRAFLSYSHADAKLAKWLHRNLEAFRIDSDVVGRETSIGPVPKTLQPIFRDRDEFTAGHTLAEQTLESLDQSMALIVLCSTVSAKSFYVNEEVRLFRVRHPDRPVIPVIVDGQPGNPQLECFPPAVRFEIAADGIISDTPTDLLAADIRDSADGKDLAISKVVARLIGVATDDVHRRAMRQRVKRRRLLTLTLATLSLVFATIAAIAMIQLYRVETARQLGNAQLLARRQPTEALLALSELKDRWLIDKSLLPQLSPELIDARLTVSRSLVGDSVHGIAWLPTGGYAAASSNGHAYVWSADHQLTSKIPVRLAITGAEKQGFGNMGIPLSKIWSAENGAVLLTTDWKGCLRSFRLSDTAGLAEGGPQSQTCLNANAGSEIAHSGAFAIANNGDVAYALKDTVELQGPGIANSSVPIRNNKIEALLFDRKRRLFALFDDGVVQLHVETGGFVDVARDHSRLDSCPDGNVWGTNSEGTVTRFGKGAERGISLAGKGPWRLSRACKHYLDSDGHLYRMEGGQEPILKGIAEWKGNEVTVKFAFSENDRFLAVSSHNGVIRVHDLTSGSSFYLLGHTQRVFEMSFNPQETQLLTASFDGSVRVFDLYGTIMSKMGNFPGAESVYASMEGGPVVSATPQDYNSVKKLPNTQLMQVKALPKGSMVPIRHDWRVGDKYLLADGDTQFTAICHDDNCSADKIVRRLQLDFVGSGGNVDARASSDGDFIVALDDKNAISIFDLRRRTDKPLLTLKDEEATSAAFDSKLQLLYILRREALTFLPFGPTELSGVVRHKIKYCLSVEELGDLFSESGWLALRRERNCRGNRVLP